MKKNNNMKRQTEFIGVGGYFTSESRIPKTIHLMWFSGEDYPPIIKKCIDSWKVVLPDFKIKVWTKEMALECNIPFVAEAINARRWAFAADVLRLYALYKEGGVYMDSDIFVLKRFDDYMNCEVCFFHEYYPKLFKKSNSSNYIKDGIRLSEDLPVGIGIQAAFIIARKGNEKIRRIMDYYMDRHFLKNNGELEMDIIAPTIYAIQLEKYGYLWKDEKIVLSQGEYVFPSCLIGNPYFKDNRSFAIHCAHHSWYDNTLIDKLKKIGLRILKPLFRYKYVNSYTNLIED